LDAEFHSELRDLFPLFLDDSNARLRRRSTAFVDASQRHRGNQYSLANPMPESAAVVSDSIPRSFKCGTHRERAPQIQAPRPDGV
jgi:hypothetical protein